MERLVSKIKLMAALQVVYRVPLGINRGVQSESAVQLLKNARFHGRSENDHCHEKDSKHVDQPLDNTYRGMHV